MAGDDATEQPGHTAAGALAKNHPDGSRCFGCELWDLVQAFANRGSMPSDIIDGLLGEVGAILASMEGTERDVRRVLSTYSARILEAFRTNRRNTGGPGPQTGVVH